MRDLIKEFVIICAENLPFPEPIYEFGSLQVQGQEGYADLRPFFPGKKYVGADIRSGPGVDVILNLHDIDLPSESIGSVLSLDTLEHVEYPRKAIREVYRILRPNGIFIVSSVMNFPIHDYPYDIWRFTPEGFISLLNIFPCSFVEFAGEDSFPHTVTGIGFKEPISENVGIAIKSKLENWKKQVNSPIYNLGAKNLIILFLPPILLHLCRKIKSCL